MSEQTKYNSLNLRTYHLPIILSAYTIFAFIFGYAFRFRMNPDGVSELRLAGYITEGNFLQSVSSGYSPLITWLYAPFMLLGLDGLTAARIVIALCGAGLLLCTWLLAPRFDLLVQIKFAAILIAAPLIAFWTIQFISPDVLFAALTLCYMYLVTNPDILTRRTAAFVCGLAAGFSYLAHHYAMPFFLVHFPALLLTRGYMDKKRKSVSWKNIFKSWGAGITGFLIIASVWIIPVSVKYGHLIISPKGGIAHAIMGPGDKDRRHPFFVGGLFKPRDDYALHIFEDISDVTFETWSPFESREYFMHQIKLIITNGVSILNHFVNKSPFFTYIPVIVVLAFIPFALLLNTLTNKTKFLYSWVVITFCIYCSGFLLLIARSPRRFYTLMLVFLLLSAHFIGEITRALRNIISGRKNNFLTLYFIIILISAFAVKPCIKAAQSFKHIITAYQVNPYEELAQQIGKVDFPAPYAVVRSSQKPTTDYYMAYFLKKQLLGRPLSADVGGITGELMSVGGKSLLVFDNPDLTEKLMLDRRYVHVASVKLPGSKRYEDAANWIVVKHEIITGWDDEVDIFTLK